MIVTPFGPVRRARADRVFGVRGTDQLPDRDEGSWREGDARPSDAGSLDPYTFCALGYPGNS